MATDEPNLCSDCGQPARGYAFINEKRYCHEFRGDKRRRVGVLSCYDRAYRATSPVNIRSASRRLWEQD